MIARALPYRKSLPVTSWEHDRPTHCLFLREGAETKIKRLFYKPYQYFQYNCVTNVTILHLDIIVAMYAYIITYILDYPAFLERLVHQRLV